ncbi:MAG TPA: iron uptake transporter deferrochelatase/peroxidase subunit [Stellaceae bacterium]|nr:iron uptake transporter deferrochelatase/peroxidase subunit [Stellaceae bacterium]
MSESNGSGMGGGGKCPFATRRGFLAAAGGLIAAVGAGPNAEAATDTKTVAAAKPETIVEPFWGRHQGGIVTQAQKHTYFAAFDLTAKNRAEIVELLKTWTAAAAQMTQGKPARPIGSDLSVPAGDSADALDLSPARLTVTFGFGAGLFVKDGQDRYGLAAHRPAALVDMPRFNGDQLAQNLTGGDLSVQACADDPQVAFHAVRQLARLAYDVAQLRYTQTGFLPNSPEGTTSRNLMGFKDGTQTPPEKPTADNPLSRDDVVWVEAEGGDWMRDGSYLVFRRIRMALEHWDRTVVDFQEQVIGRRKYSGAPLGAEHEFDPLDLDATDKEGNPVIPDTAHVRLAAAASNDGAQIFRRGYAYNDGTNVTAERWPPWRQGLEYDAGLLFLSYQKDPRTGFIKIYENMAKLDMLNQYTTHVGSGLFACPGGPAEGEFIGQRLFEKA